MGRLFVNADDFGLTDGVCEGIVAALRAGVVGGTTAMVCLPGAIGRIRRYAPAIPGRVGLHVQLTSGEPCLPPGGIPTLVGPDGRFPAKKTLIGTLDPDEVLREWRAQYERLRQAGVEPTHLDAHHHAHKRPEAFTAYLALARELGLPARAVSDGQRAALAAAGVAHADVCVLSWFGEALSAERFLSLAAAAFETVGEEGLVEVMAHPGRADEALSGISSYASGREAELGVLGSPDLARELSRRGIVPVGPEGLC